MHAALRRATRADHDEVVDVLTEAFAEDPLASWLFPAAAERHRLQSRFYRHQLAHPAAEVYLTDRGKGVALWHALSPAEPAEDEAPESDLEAAFGDSGPRLRALGRALAPRHPVDRPHLYLFCMGVVGSRRGSGLGSAMLRDRLERADAEGVAAYLEASSPRSRALYLRHGFTDLDGPVRPAGGPSLWPMWREPQP
ncbi:GNAT family N-acetyltransferase [Saccharopolyspora dendranthemae]|uniref:Acetyltransferase (GNAT) family protein n=1 Tax=Saccharopolyspora dendranthemae TaxID=1181886 RepID=A0A561V820_9PSEU|nr:GNAT family N-acetyltransferase [Saccharopolyspora dendranthemae]TWG07762.1 acetyltransferase (GNAT) family protein [Saccharopolyspora dendranthemae]